MSGKWKESRNWLNKDSDSGLMGNSLTASRPEGVIGLISQERNSRENACEVAFQDFLKDSPSLEGVDLERSPEPMREVSL
jgi:hypothetical protein